MESKEREREADMGVVVYRWPITRPNNVPYYQRLFQNGDGKRQWWKVRLLSHLIPSLSTHASIFSQAWRTESKLHSNEECHNKVH